MQWTTEQKTFIVEAYFRLNSIHAAQLQFGCREFPAHTMIYRWVNKFRAHGTVNNPDRTVCKGHYTLPSALHGSPSPNMAPLDHSESRTTTSGLWQSTPSNMFRCLANSGQHLVDEEGLLGTSSVSSGMVPFSHLKRIIGMATAWFPWPTDQPQVWVVAPFSRL